MNSICSINNNLKGNALSTTIINGDFSLPAISSNTHQYLSVATYAGNWYFSAGMNIVNGTTAWNYPLPYPSPNQILNFQGSPFSYATIYLRSGVNYQLSFYVAARSSGGILLNVDLRTTSDVVVSQIATGITSINSWQLKTYTFTVPSSQGYRLFFQTVANGGLATAIDNVQITIV